MTRKVSPSVVTVTAPSRSVRKSLDPICSYLLKTSGWGRRPRFRGPTLRIANVGLTFSRSRGVLEERLPWCGTLRRSAFRGYPWLTIRCSASSSISPGRRKAVRPYWRRRTRERLFVREDRRPSREYALVDSPEGGGWRTKRSTP